MLEEARLTKLEENVENINTKLLTVKIYAKVILIVAGAIGITATGIISYLLVQVGQIDSTVRKAKESAINEIIGTGTKEVTAVKQEANNFRLLAVPIGTIVPYAGPIRETEVDKPEEKLAVRQFAENVEKQGWMICDGRPLLRDEFPELYKTLGQAHGSGFDKNGRRVGDFNLPDYRGIFLRGVDHGAGRDPESGGREAASGGGNSGDRVGSCQGPSTGPHMHHIQVVSHQGIPSNKAFVAGEEGNSPSLKFSQMAITDTWSGKESRPQNAYVNYLIRTM